MKIAALMPTYGRPSLVSNSLACFLAQDYYTEHCRLFILDDAGQFENQTAKNWQMYSTTTRYNTLVDKYTFLVRQARRWGADAYAIWDDDDIYLSWHMAAHAKALAKADSVAGWSKPARVWSLYTGKLEIESSDGRFHGALAFSEDAGRKIGYWQPSTMVSYDQKFMQQLRKLSLPKQSDADCVSSYVYRWGSTGAYHCSGATNANGVDWYAKAPITEPGYVGELRPKMDPETLLITAQIKQHG